MNIPKFSVDHRPVIAILLAMAMVIGILNYFTISQREDPEFKISIALVVTIYPGASAEKVERLVTNKLEESFEEITVVDELISTTREDLSVIMVRVDYEADTDIAWQKLRNKIEETRPDLPDSIIGPDVHDDFGDVTAMIYTLSSDSASPAELRDWAKVLQSRLKRLETVGKAELLGEQQEAIYIEGPLESFTMYDFNPLAAARILDYQNVNMPGGYVRTGDRKYRLEVSGSFKLTQQIENAILDVSRKSGTPLKVKDVFSVRQAYKEPPMDFMEVNGTPAIGLDIRMKKGRNLVVMGEQVKQVAADFKDILPPNIELTLVHDQPYTVAKFVDSFMNNLFEGLLIVILVMFLAMGWRAAGMIAVSLPLSIILTFAVMPLFNVVFETVSIAAFIIALGMLVDNAIIITDNIDVHMKKTTDRLKASIQGAQELAIPALTGTLATMFAFLPLLLMPNEQGDYIRALPIIVSVSLLASLVLALTLTPMASHLFLKPKAAKQTDANGNAAPNAFVRGYRRLMTWSLRHWLIMVALTLLSFVGALMLLPQVGFSFFPQAERDQFMIDIWLPEGSSLAHTAAIADQVDADLKKEAHIENCVSYIGKGGPRFYITIKPEFNSTNYAQLVCRTDDPLVTRDIVTRLNHKFMTEIDGARVLVSNLWMGTPVEAPIALRITGPDLTVSKRISGQLQDILKSIPGTLHVRDNVGDAVPSLKVDVDSTAAAMSGISNTEIAVALLTAYEGLPVTSLREGEEEIPVYMRLVESERNMTNTLDGVQVPSQATGKKVPLNTFADIKMDWAPGVIKRFDGERAVTALADIEEGLLAADIMAQIQPRLKQIDLPRGYRISEAGEAKERNEAFGTLIKIFALIVMLILLMLVIQFNSFKRALVILASIPLAIIGAILGLYFSGNSFAFMPFLGVISLAGIVIKNAVVWVEFADRYLEDGHSLAESIVEAGHQRLRPILLTAATTIGGLIPLAMFGGILWEGMAWAMIVGLALATVLTLVVVPVFYYIMFKRRYA